MVGPPKAVLTKGPNLTLLFLLLCCFSYTRERVERKLGFTFEVLETCDIPWKPLRQHCLANRLSYSAVSESFGTHLEILMEAVSKQQVITCHYCISPACCCCFQFCCFLLGNVFCFVFLGMVLWVAMLGTSVVLRFPVLLASSWAMSSALSSWALSSAF